MNLHNRVSRKELKERVLKDGIRRVTLSFYRYVRIEDPTQFRNHLYSELVKKGIFGRIYLATEGINAQVSVPESDLASFKTFLQSIPSFEGMRLNKAVDEGPSFFVLDIKVRDKIVADGIQDPGFSMEQKGDYVNAVQMNKLMDNPDTIVIDMRNHYEFEVGHFVNALEIPSDTFREQLPMAAAMMEPHKEKNIIMYCTGGIRCEKASAYMLHQGFKNVFHLEGGILHYVAQVKEQGLDSKFIGKNFVFDERLGERVTAEVIAHCHQCGQPADSHTNCRNEACHLLFIQCEDCAKTYAGCCSTACQDFMQLPPEERKTLRKGIDKGRNVFNKSKSRKLPGK